MAAPEKGTIGVSGRLPIVCSHLPACQRYSRARNLSVWKSLSSASRGEVRGSAIQL
jgi:hypothetical protein